MNRFNEPKTRIGLQDTVMDMLIKMSGGNPGALTVLSQLMREGDAIDPDNIMGGLGNILSLDTHQIYDDKIWIFYKDVCGQSLVTMLGLLRAVQLGFMPESELKAAIRNERIDIEVEMKYLAQVRARLPAFGGR